jgi:hypothetical protein
MLESYRCAMEVHSTQWVSSTYCSKRSRLHIDRSETRSVLSIFGITNSASAGLIVLPVLMILGFMILSQTYGDKLSVLEIYRVLVQDMQLV